MKNSQYRLSYYTREALYRHISSVINVPYKSYTYRIKDGVLSWKVIGMEHKGSITLAELAVLTKKLEDRYSV